MRPERYAIVGLLAVCLLGGCMIRELASDESELIYTYSSLDFSGKVWQRAQQQCQRTEKKVVHKTTECSDWFRCVSRFSCDVKQ
jgi:hypothetical protein